MIKKCLVLSIVWIILLSLTSIRAPLAQKYKGPAADGPDKNIQPREETVIDRSSVILRHIAQARTKIHENNGGGTAHP
ncbi:hypothetical protein [Geotalea uraniireducens]|uniref:hypothetical protein n=1 Tax=Geotalea uraniireducens TaxID=351604 RepID=UPI0002FA1CFD